MLLRDLLKEVNHRCSHGTEEIGITSICHDSRNVVPGSVFVCIRGSLSDGHKYAEAAVKKGALAVIAEYEPEGASNVTVILTDDCRIALARMSAEWFGRPAEKLITIGITGTKGKSTTSYMIKSILETAGRKVGLIGTIETIIGERHIPAVNTTPESYIVQQYFSDMVKEGCDTVVMEISSQGLMLNRVAGIIFDYGIFTNIEPDHISEFEHADFDDYLRCKSLLFRQCRTGILNADDSKVQNILKGNTCDTIETFGIENKTADIVARDIELFREGGVIGIEYSVSGTVSCDVKLNIPGRFNVYNSLTAIAVCSHFTKDVEIMKRGLLIAKAKGRLEPVNISGHFHLMIDYAHNAMALESLLTTLREYAPERLVCLFGCGGNRARDRRFEMGEISSKLADLTVVTSDNPRDEEPQAIIEDILTGVKRADGDYISIPDRREAIRYVIENAREGDVIVLAGKGHEDYQEIKGRKYHMDEREIIADIIKGNN